MEGYLPISVPNTTVLPALVKGTAYDIVYIDDSSKTIGNETKVTYSVNNYLLSEVGGVPTYQNILFQFALS